jgi:hypothetical protein
MPKNIAVELGIHSLAFGSKFMVNNSSNVKKHNVRASSWSHCSSALPSSVLGILDSSIAKTDV